MISYCNSFVAIPNIGYIITYGLRRKQASILYFCLWKLHFIACILTSLCIWWSIYKHGSMYYILLPIASAGDFFENC